MERLPPKHSSVEVGESEKRGTKRSLETCEPLDDVELRREEHIDNESSSSNRRCLQSISQEKPRKRQKKGEEMLKLLQKHLCSPIRSVTGLPVWLNHPEYKFLDEEDTIVKKVFTNWERQLCSWTIEDFNTLYNQPGVNIYFGAGHNDFKRYYYNVEDSLDLLIALLNNQFSNDQENIVNFVTDLFDVVELQHQN